MPIVNVSEAKTQLSRLLTRVEAGEEVIIVRCGKPVARLVRYKPRGKRKFGSMKGRIRITDAFFEPLPNEELKPWEGAPAARVMRAVRALERHTVVIPPAPALHA